MRNAILENNLKEFPDHHIVKFASSSPMKLVLRLCLWIAATIMDIACVASVSVSKERSVFCPRKIWGRAKNGTRTKRMRGVGEGPRSVFFWFSPIFRSGETSKIPFSVFLCSPIPRKRLLRRLVCILIFFHSNVPFLKWQIGKRSFRLTFVFLNYWMKYKVVIRWRTFRSE